MKKPLLYFFTIIYSTFCFAQQKWCSIKAFLPRWNGAEINLFSNGQLIYSNKVKGDIFSYTGAIENITEGVLMIKSGKNIFYVPLFLEPGTIKVRDAGGHQFTSVGTASNDQYIELNTKFDSLAVLSNKKGFSELLQYKRKLATEYINTHPTSIVSIQLLKDFFHLSAEADDSIYYALTRSLKSSFPNSSSVVQMLAESNTRFATARGRSAPRLELADTAGTKKAVYTEGEFTLIDFWASWCVPCRKDNVALKKLYNKYHNIGFTITSISLDSKKLLWENAIKQDRMPWLQLSDLKGWDGIPTQVYGVKAIPMNFLTDKKGTIIAKNLSTDQLDKLLHSLLNKQSF